MSAPLGTVKQQKLLSFCNVQAKKNQQSSRRKKKTLEINWNIFWFDAKPGYIVIL